MLFLEKVESFKC